jgi:hypothetical protein
MKEFHAKAYPEIRRNELLYALLRLCPALNSWDGS